MPTPERLSAGPQLLKTVLALAVSIGLAAHEPLGPPQTFRTGVEAVEIDVSVLDSKREPVRGLKAADFFITEDGKAQPIIAFAAVDLPPWEMTAAAWTREIARDVVSNQFNMQRVVVVLIDDFNIEFNPSDAETARRIGREVIDQLGPADVAAVVYTFNRNKGQEFTTDRGLLRASVDRFASNSLFAGGGACRGEPVRH